MIKALLLGIEEPEGQKLAEFLLGNGYEVHAGYYEKIKDILRTYKDLESKVIFHNIKDNDDIEGLIGRLKIDQVYKIHGRQDKENSDSQNDDGVIEKWNVNSPT